MDITIVISMDITIIISIPPSTPSDKQKAHSPCISCHHHPSPSPSQSNRFSKQINRKQDNDKQTHHVSIITPSLSFSLPHPTGFHSKSTANRTMTNILTMYQSSSPSLPISFPVPQVFTVNQQQTGQWQTYSPCDVSVIITIPPYFLPNPTGFHSKSTGNRTITNILTMWCISHHHHPSPFPSQPHRFSHQVNSKQDNDKHTRHVMYQSSSPSLPISFPIPLVFTPSQQQTGKMTNILIVYLPSHHPSPFPLPHPTDLTANQEQRVKWQTTHCVLV